MKPRFLITLALLVWPLTIVLAPVIGAQQSSQTVIRMRGSNVMANFCDGIARAFNEKQAEIRVVVSGGGTDAGFEALFEKSAQVVMATREITDKERQAAAVSSVSPERMLVGSQAIAVITNPVNPITELTLEQVRMIFTGEITNWRDVGGPDEQIQVVTSPQISGTAQFLRGLLLEQGYFASDAHARDYYIDIIKEVAAKKPLAIGYAGLLDAERGATKGMVKLLWLKTDPMAKAVYPSIQTMKDGTYPVVQPFYLYWDSNVKRQDVQTFLEFFKTRIEGSR